MMENKKITHIDWKAIEDKYGNHPLTEVDVCAILRIPRLALQHFLIDGRIHQLSTIAEVKKMEPTTGDGYETVLGYLAGFLRGTSDNIVERFTIKKGGK